MFCFLVQISLPSLIKLKASCMVIAYDIFSTKTCRTVPLIFFLFLEGGRGHPCLRTNQEPCKTCALHAKQATCEYVRFAHIFCSVVTEQSIWLTELAIVGPILIANKKETKFFGNICQPKYFFETQGRLRSSFNFSRPKPKITVYEATSLAE